jgi:hypothetical protein
MTMRRGSESHYRGTTSRRAPRSVGVVEIGVFVRKEITLKEMFRLACKNHYFFAKNILKYVAFDGDVMCILCVKG